jgi:DNA-binding NarL/FixJ family response regulator
MRTTREREILQLAAEGLTNAGTAEKLSIRQRMMIKMDFFNQTDLIRFALKKGILPMDS